MKKMPKNWHLRIRNKIEELAMNPYVSNNNVTKLIGREAYRMRVGDFRVIYEIHDNELLIQVVDIGSRGGVYQ